ncbi:MAG TPA: NAD-binding protein, partial [Alicycliphilus sp.]|nr:NAD-binding protein [Alicycliphilus sp.]
MPSNQNPLGALPARFRRQRLLIIGCGDIGLRVARGLRSRLQVLALTQSPERVPALRAAGITPLVGDLDAAASLARLAGLATRVLHLAPPPALGEIDARSLALARALRRRALPQALVYVSTSGVYGDCAGDWVAESRPVAPATPRALRRVNAERSLRHLGRA